MPAGAADRRRQEAEERQQPWYPADEQQIEVLVVQEELVLALVDPPARLQLVEVHAELGARPDADDRVVLDRAPGLLGLLAPVLQRVLLGRLLGREERLAALGEPGQRTAVYLDAGDGDEGDGAHEREDADPDRAADAHAADEHE